MKKMLMTVMLVMVFCVILIADSSPTSAYAGPKQPETGDYGKVVAESKELSVWTCSSGWKVGRDWKMPRESARYVTLSLAKNEREAIQLVFIPSVTLSNVKISISDLHNGNNTLSADDIDILQVSYLNITESSDGTYPKGYWPDPLLPVRKPLILKKCENHPFWIRVHVPAKLHGGTYEGRITIFSDQITRKIPFRVTVFDFTLPDVMTCRTLFWKQIQRNTRLS